MRIRAKDVALFVAAEHGLTFADLLSDTRKRHVARPRQIAMHTIKALCPHMSYPAVGTMLGGRDHTTILHGDRKIEALKAVDPDIKRAVDRTMRHFSPTSQEAFAHQFRSLCAFYNDALGMAA